MSSRWPMVPLGEVLAKSENWISIHPDQRYKEVTVRLWGKGAVLRREVLGAEIAASTRLQVQANQFIISRIDARNGASGLIPEDLEGAVVSNDFPVFTPNATRLEPKLLGWLSKTKDFVELCKAASEGTTNRVRLKEDRFLAMSIPLPPLAEQRRLVERIDALAGKIEEAKRLRRQVNGETGVLASAEASQIFDGLREYATVSIGTLGIDGSNPVQTGPFGAQLHASEFVSDGVPVLNVGNVWPEGLDVRYLDHVLPWKAQALRRYTLHPDDLLFARSGATLGKVCLVPQRCNGWLMTGHLFRVRFDQTRCDPRFALAGLRGAKSIRDQVFGQVRGATRPGFNTTLLSRVRLPLPPLNEQRQVVEYLNRLQTKVNTLKRDQAEAATELDTLLPAILARAFLGEL